MSLQIHELRVTYSIGKNTIKALDDVSLDLLLDRKTMGIVGESGSGKTTLGMSIMNSIEPPGVIEGGSIEYNDTNILKLSEKDLRQYRWEQVSMVYQSAMNSLNPVKNVRDPIVEVLQEHLHIPRKEAIERAVKLLSEVGIKQERSEGYPHEFSGGMRQRVVIALALALSPRLLIADEPTSALDVVTQRQILSLLKKKVSSAGLSLLFITHEISVLSGLVEEAVVMFAGQIVERGPIAKVFGEPLHPYTEALLRNLLTIDSKVDLSSALTSTIKRESPIAMLSANFCKYSSRCKYAFERCVKEKPMFREIQKGRWVACHKFE